VRNTTIYLASAIDQSTTSKLYAPVFEVLSRSGYVVYDPKSAFALDPLLMDGVRFEEANEAARYIFGVNNAALKHANMRVFLVEKTPSWGVPIELKLTVESGWPFTMVISRDLKLPVYLRVLLDMAKACIVTSEEVELAEIIYKRLSVDPNEKYHIWYSSGRANKVDIHSHFVDAVIYASGVDKGKANKE
jgi:hypothetical protein